MPVTISVDEAQATLKELIHQLPPDGEIILTENSRPVAKLVSESPKTIRQRPAPGLGQGSIVYMADDFDAQLDEFKEYAE